MSSSDEARFRKERDLYRQCLDLTRTEDPAPLLERTLQLLRELAGAERGYIELCDVASPDGRKWSADAGVDDDERELIRRRISQGIIAEAIETDRTVHTPSAALDDRFSQRESVRAGKIEAVLCVPLRAENVVGAVYLQNRIAGGPFGEDDVRATEAVTRFVSSIAARMLELIRRRGQADATTSVRTRLRGSSEIVGRSPALAELFERLVVVAAMETNTLLTGPSGSGKSTLARILHENSRRAAGPFVELNCAALPVHLVESELFGAERGAHSGVAHKGMPGKVAAAEGGTLFLDEIGDLDRGVQAKLLQLLQSKEYFRLGSSTPLRANIRIVAATHHDLHADVAAGSFRDDLYYRIRGVELRVPSLGERRDDVPLLAEHLCRRVCEEAKLPSMTLSPAALAAIEFAEWRGNVRELRTRCEEAAVNAHIEGVTTIELRHLFPERRKPGDDVPETFQAARARLEKSFLAAALAQRDWNVALTARELEMSRSHLNALIRRYGLTRSHD